MKRVGLVFKTAARSAHAVVRSLDALVAVKLYDSFPPDRAKSRQQADSDRGPTPGSEYKTRVILVQFGFAKALHQHGNTVSEWFGAFNRDFDEVSVLDPAARAQSFAGQQVQTSWGPVRVYGLARLSRLPKWVPLDNTLLALDLLRFIKSMSTQASPMVTVYWSASHDLAGWIATTLASTQPKSSSVVEVRANYALMHSLHGHSFFVRINSKVPWASRLAWHLSAPRLSLVLRRANIVIGRNLNNLEGARELAALSGGELQEDHLIRIEFDPDVVREIQEGQSRESADLLNRTTANCRRTPIVEGGRTVVFVARMVDEKFPLDVIEAWAKVHPRVADAKLVMIGDGPLRQVAQNACEELGLSESVFFLGALSIREALWHVSRAEVGIETYGGSSLVEKGLLGCPVIAYDIEWHSELIFDGTTGKAVEFGDTDGLAEAICAQLENRDLAISMAAKLKVLCESEFSPLDRLKRESQIAQSAVQLCL